MTQLSATYLASLILRSIGIALIAGICSWKIRNVAMRHAIWVAVLGAVLLMPAVDYLLPAPWVPARIQQIASEQPITLRIPSARITGVQQPPAPAGVTFPSRPSPVNVWNVAATLYALVAFAMFIRLTLGYRKTWMLRRSGRTIASPVWKEIIASHRIRWRTPVLMESEVVQVPMTIGFIRPVVILPADWKTWDDGKLRAVLFHEIAHVRRCDWAIAAISTISKCGYWLNPVVWFLERKLSQLAEQACDDATLSNTQNPTRYAEILLEFAVAVQNVGRLMKGGVAMAQPNMKARIDRALGNRKTGTGIVRTAGWILLMLSAAPVIYSAAALQVTSEPVRPIVATYAAEFGRNPLPQVPAAVAQAAPPRSAPATTLQAQQDSSSPASELRDPFQMELENRKIQREYEELKQKLAEAQQAADPADISPAQGPQRAAMIGGPVAFLQDELKKMEEQQRTLQASMLQQSQVNPAPPSALLNLPGNRDDLVAYLNQLASLRMMQKSFSVSFTRTQGRTIFMKVSDQDFSFGCESCSFFVGESLVSGTASAPPGPGLMIRLSPDGRELTITCRATICNMGFEDGNTGQPTLRKFVSGDSDTFAASKLRSVVISKD